MFGQAQLAILNSSFVEAPISGSITVLHLPSVKDAGITTALSVLRVPTGSVTPMAQVSVRRLPATETGAPVAQNVSVRRNDVSISGSPQSAGVSLTTGPLVQSLTPTSASKGTNFTITISGANLSGATALSFITTAGAVDSTITASNISVDSNGTSLTAMVTVSESAVLGQRVVVVTTAAGNSFTVVVGFNVLEIVQ